MASQNFRIKNGITVGKNGTILTTSDNGNIGIGSTNPSSKLSVVGDVNISGIITANKFVGDGSLLVGVIGIGSGVGIRSNNQNIGIASQINFSSSFFVQPPNNGIVNVQSNLTLDDIVAIGSVTSNSISVGNIVSNGDVLAYSFVGDGSNLTGISTGLIAQSIVSEVSNSSLGISGISAYTQIATLNETADPNSDGIIAGTYTADEYGIALKCSGDGNILYVGSPNDKKRVSVGATTYYTGMVYAYQRTSSGFNKVGVITGPPSYPTYYSGGQFNRMQYPRFGYSLECTYDGKRLFIEDYNSYITYIYDRMIPFGSTNPIFNYVGIISAASVGYPGASYTRFLTKSNASGSLIYYYQSGTGYVYALRNQGKGYSVSGIVTTTGFQYSSASVTCDASGDFVCVGAGGSVHIFDRTQNWDGTSTFNKVGILTAYLPSPPGDNGDGFGISLACSADGKTIFVGSSTEEVVGIGTTINYGAVYVFDRVGNNFNPVTVLTGLDPNVYNWMTFPNFAGQQFPASRNDQYGSTLSCSFDGNILAVGAAYDELPGTNGTSSGETGIVYIYNRQGNTFNLVSSLVGPPAESDGYGLLPDFFGAYPESLSMSANGRTIFVGVPGGDPVGLTDNNGEARIYEQQRTTLISSSSASGNIGIGTTNPTSKLTVQGDASFSGVITATAFHGTVIGFTTQQSSYASVAGIATYSQTSGIATYATTAGIATIAQGFTGNANVSVQSLVATAASTTFLTVTGVITAQQASITNLSASGIITATSGISIRTSSGSTSATMTSSGNASFAGIVTASGGFNLGIQSSGINVSTGVITSINFSGDGITCSYENKTASINFNSGNISNSKQTVSGTTTQIGIGSTANLTLSAAKSYLLYKVGVSTDAWVNIYTDSLSRTNDASRSETMDPSPGSGVISEIITTGISTTALMTPSVVGFNNDDPPTSNVYLSVKNKGTQSQQVTVTLHYLPLEV